tara:strand:- start:26 stop:1177 length:1152 start_codon:yes stop_codon:yes gene_type:complete
MFSIATLIFYTIPAILICVFNTEGNFFTINRELLAYQNLIITIFLIVVFRTSLLISNSKKKFINFNFNENKIIILSVAMLLVGNLTKLFLLNSGMYNILDAFNQSSNNISRLLVFTRNIDLWGIVLLSIIVSKNLYSNKYNFIKSLYLFELIFLIGFSIVQGRRTGAIIPILIFILSYSFYHKFNLKKFIWPLLVSLSLMIITTYKRLIESGTVYNEEIRDLILESIFTRLGNPYIILNKVIDFGHKSNFHSFELSIIGIIPSIFLSDKPNLSIGNEFGKELGLISVNNEGIGINPGWIGESYYNYGIIGVIVGAVVFSFITNYFLKKSILNNDSSKIFLIMLFIFNFSGYQMEIAASLNSFLKGYLILILITSFLSKYSLEK